MVWACTTARRGRLCQTDLGGKRRWTTEQRKTEKEMDQRRQVQWRTCSSTWRMQSIKLNGEEEPVWLTPYLRDPQPEGEREREIFEGHVTPMRTNIEVTLSSYDLSVDRQSCAVCS